MKNKYAIFDELGEKNDKILEREFEEEKINFNKDRFAEAEEEREGVEK
ncbi:MAG: hypothetical protein ACOCP8_10215 [archaeon]